MMSGKLIDMNMYSFFKIPLYFPMLGWEMFVTLKVNFTYLRLVCLFFANVIINEEILKITSHVKGSMIVLNKKYISGLI